jgi:membrane protease YdiL (CAAX protease family)
MLTIALSVILTWMYNGTGGSLLIVVLFHAGINLPLTVLYEPLEDQIALPFLIYVALMILVAAVVVAATGPATLSRTRAKQVAVP